MYLQGASRKVWVVCFLAGSQVGLLSKTRGTQSLSTVSKVRLWFAGNEGMEKKRKTIIVGISGLYRDDYKDPFFIPR